MSFEIEFDFSVLGDVSFGIEFDFSELGDLSFGMYWSWVSFVILKLSCVSKVR